MTAATKITAGSEEWSKRIRRKAKTLSRTLDTGYMEMAELLHVIHDTPVNGDPKNQSVWASWGYSVFGEYVENELGIHRRKAERLRRIWEVLETDLAGLDRGVKRQLIAIGWTKMRELIRVLTVSNAERWIEMAEECSYPELRANIARAIEIAAQKNAVSGDDEEHEEVPPPEGERTKSMAFNLFPEQLDNVTLALKRASELSNSDKKGHNFDLICTDFLATNDFRMENDPEAQLRLLAKYERLLHKRLVVVDPASKRIVYGLDALELVATDMEVE